jgi:hypothetical protein
MKKLQLSTLAALLLSISILECSQFYRPSKKIITSVAALGTAGVGYYVIANHQNNDVHQQAIATFKKLGVQYSNEITTENHEVPSLTKKYSREIKGLIRNQNTAIVRNGIYTAEQLKRIQENLINSDENGLRKDIKIERINDQKGYGAIATVNIPRESSIGIYAGIARHSDNIEDASYAFDSFYICNKRPGDSMTSKHPIIGEMQIDAAKAGNITRFINAPCDDSQGNCHALNMMDKNDMPQVLFVANKEIKAGEELTVGYGPKYSWKNKRF